MCGPFIDTAADSSPSYKYSHSVYKTSFSRWHQNRTSYYYHPLMLRLICRTEELPPPLKALIQTSSSPGTLEEGREKGGATS